MTRSNTLLGAAARVAGLCAWFLVVSESTAGDFTFDSLVTLVRAGEVHSVESALAALPAELRANYTLVFASRSLQGASAEAPRAILYGATAHFIVTFNGDPTQRGFAALETMQFDEQTNSFHFREILFDGSDGGANVSEDNPARCTVCHGRPARPIWDTPPTWPGVYGQRYGSGLSKEEAAGMRAFLAHQSADSRYRLLIDARRFADRSTYVADAQLRYGGGRFEPPNAQLSALLATLNVRRITSRIFAPDGAWAHRYAILAAASSNCGDIESFFPEAGRAHLRAALSAFANHAAGLQRRQDQVKQLRGSDAPRSYDSGMKPKDPTELRFVAEQIVGMPQERWTLALEGDSNDLAAPDGALTLEQLLFERIAVAEPDLRDLRAFRDFTPSDAYCAELRRRSIRDLTAHYAARAATGPEIAQPAQPDAATGIPHLLDRCVECHNGQVGPELPFTDPAQLAVRLRATGYPHGRLLDEVLYRLSPEAGQARMPRGLTVTAAEQHALEDYFVSLASRSPTGGN